MEPGSGQDGSMEVVEADGGQVELVAPLFDAYRQFYQQPPDRDAARAFLAQRLARGESRVLLALLVEGGARTPVGFTQLYPSFSSIALKPAWILYDLFVAPAARRRGVGRILLERARQLAEATGASELTLQTAVGNHAAQALYESLGWRRDEQFLTYTLVLSSGG
jgi:GNAT superfamily N-acetyltransferase